MTHRLESIIDSGSIVDLKKAVIVDGLVVEEDHDEELIQSGHTTLRGRVWKLLLGVTEVNANEYVNYVKMGKSGKWEAILNDSFRTFAKNEEFKNRVPEGKLIRVLNAFEHWNSEMDGKFVYVQGLNVLCAPLLYVMSEVDAFFALRALVNECPRYVTGDLPGVKDGCELMEKCLQELDPPLAHHLTTRGLPALVYGYSPILSLMACFKPLNQLLRIWDVLFSFGVHSAVVFSLAQFMFMRNKILKTLQPMPLLSTELKPLNAAAVISLGVKLLDKLSPSLYTALARHPLYADPHKTSSDIGNNVIRSYLSPFKQKTSRPKRAPPSSRRSTISTSHPKPSLQTSRQSVVASGGPMMADHSISLMPEATLPTPRGRRSTVHRRVGSLDKSSRPQPPMVHSRSSSAERNGPSATEIARQYDAQRRRKVWMKINKLGGSRSSTTSTSSVH
eukprot:TRINITY_DN8297_c0_g1_i1.p1 TRINITY_DN8297_c0_g1~~TRINITY_DN8297_c0_g1_i1.p1  ORF type:complete len:447 (-),score=102.96 TRINITY_DN8297_c0_g1_i1:173-1513(-)